VTVIAFTMFKDALLTGRKRQTIRRLCRVGDDIEARLREYRRKPGGLLHLWWGSPRSDPSTAYRMMVVMCTSVIPVYLAPAHAYAYVCCGRWRSVDEERLAADDGFESYAQMYEWFERTYRRDIAKLVFAVIKWAFPPVEVSQ